MLRFIYLLARGFSVKIILPKLSVKDPYRVVCMLRIDRSSQIVIAFEFFQIFHLPLHRFKKYVKNRAENCKSGLLCH